MPAYRPLADRFHEKYQMIPFSGCWLWEGGVNEHGYGIIGVTAYKTDKAHRVSWRLHKGEIPAGANVLHRCDLPGCVNPEHLFLGSLKDNAIDCAQKGRNFVPDNKGTKAVWAKLDWEKVSDIRTRRMTQHNFARLYNVSRSAVRNVQLNKSWNKE
jgi:hypothetical protein